MPNDTLRGSVAAAPGQRLRTRLVRGTLWSMLGIAALGLTRLVYTALIGRTAEPARLAEVTSMVSLAFLATFATAAATGAAAAKFLPLTAARSGPPAAAGVRRKLSRWTLGTTGLALVVLVGGGRWLLPGASWSDLGAVCALTTAYGAYTFTKSVLYGYHLPGRYAVLEVGADAVILALTVVAVMWVPDRWPAGLLVAPLVVGYLAFAVAASVSAHRGVPPEPTPRLAREMGGFVALTALGIAAGQGFFQVSMVVAGHTAGSAGAGTYAAAMSLVSPAFFLPRALALAFFPAAAEAVGRGDEAALGQHMVSVTRLLALCSLPAFGLAAMLGGPALRLVFGPSYDEGGGVFAVLVLAVFLYVVAVPAVNVLSAHELRVARIPPLASTVGVVVGTMTWLALGLSFGGHLGAVGVAAGYLAAMVVQAGCPLLMAFRRLGGWQEIRPVRYTVSLAVGIAGAAVSIALPRPWVVGAAVGVFLSVFALLHGKELASTMRAARQLRRHVPCAVPVDGARFRPTGSDTDA